MPFYMVALIFVSAFRALARVAGYIFNEFAFTQSTKAQIAGRIEHDDLHGSTPDFPADFLPNLNPQVSTARNPSFTPKSGSVGLLQNLPYDLVGSITAQYVERAPKPAELFSRGPHDATTETPTTGSSRLCTRNGMRSSAAANSRASSTSRRYLVVFGALRISSMSFAPPSPMAPTFRGFRRCASAAAYSGATPTG